MTSLANQSWNDLPVDILEKIGSRLNTETDISHFRAVCKSWRSSIPPQPVLSPITVQKIQPYYKTFFLRETIVRLSSDTTNSSPRRLGQLGD
ncbi:hypothetical protein ACLB2K_076150 [Fragaria x ananassa]